MKEKLSLFVEEYRNSFRVLSILYITNFCETRKIDSNAIQVYFLLSLDWNWPCRGEGASQQEVSTQARQREELNWPSQLKPSDQQIFSTKSCTDSILIRQRLERPSLVKAPLSVWRQSADMLAVHLVTVRLLTATGRLPRLVRRKVAMLRTFTVGF